jgi:hypothetical protein
MSPRQELARTVQQALRDLIERLPVPDPPVSGTRTLVDNGKVRTQAIFRDGDWVRPGGGILDFEPTHYMRFKR